MTSPDDDVTFLAANWSVRIFDWSATERPFPEPLDFELKQSPAMTVVYSLAYGAVFFLGLGGNTLVIWIVYSNPKMHDVTNFLIVNLAVADILVCLFCIPFTLLSNLYAGWRFGAFMCKAVPFLQGVSVNASVNTLMAIAFDRYLAICHVLRFRLTSNKARFIIVLIWVFAASVMAPWAIYYQEEYLSYNLSDPPQPICHQVWPTPSMQRIFFLTAIFLTCYTIPLVCIVVCYALIAYRVCHRHASVKSCHSSREALNKSKVKVVKMLAVVVATFACSWLPLYVVNLRLLYGDQLDEHSAEFPILVRIVIPIIQWCGSANSCVNPIIYCLFSRKFRDGFRDMIVFCHTTGYGRNRRKRGVMGSTANNSLSLSEADRPLRSIRRVRVSLQGSFALKADRPPKAKENVLHSTSV